MPLLGYFVDSQGREIPSPGTTPVVSTSTSTTSTSASASFPRLNEVSQELVRLVDQIEHALNGTLSSGVLDSWRTDLVDRFVNSEGFPTSLLRTRGSHIDERKWTAMRAHLHEMLRLTTADVNRLLERTLASAELQVAYAWTGLGFARYVLLHYRSVPQTTMPVQPQFVPNAIPDGPAEPANGQRRGRSPPRVLSGDAYDRARLAWQQGRAAGPEERRD